MTVKRVALDACAKKHHAPCKDCKRRAVGCHSSCEDYALYRKKYDAAKVEACKGCRAEVSADAYAALSRRRYQERKRSKKK